MVLLCILDVHMLVFIQRVAKVGIQFLLWKNNSFIKSQEGWHTNFN